MLSIHRQRNLSTTKTMFFHKMHAVFFLNARGPKVTLCTFNEMQVALDKSIFQICR